MTSPLIRWAGSKRGVIPVLRRYWTSRFRRYLEPFAGSACLFFDISPAKAVLNDLNAELINFYEACCAHPRRIFNLVRNYPRDSDTFYKVRKLEPSTLSDEERAARFLFLNQNCFNGLYRTNKLGAFNVPYSSKRTGAFPEWRDFYASTKVLRNAELRNEDFERFTLHHAGAGDFVYLDPPFAVQSRRVFRQYGAKHFVAKDLDRLAELLRTLDDRGARFLLSYADCREARDTFRQWSIGRTLVHRHIAGFAGHRRRAAELLIANFSPEAVDNK